MNKQTSTVLFVLVLMLATMACALLPATPIAEVTRMPTAPPIEITSTPTPSLPATATPLSTGPGTATATLPATDATTQPAATATIVGATDVPPPTDSIGCVPDSAFVADVTIPDDTAIPAGVSFVKTWRVRNTGTCTWGPGTIWFFSGGSKMDGPDAVPVPETRPGETVDISVNLVAPSTPGTYTGYWQLSLPGAVVLDESYFVRIKVPKPTPTRGIPTSTRPPSPGATPTSPPAAPTATTAPTATPATSTAWRGEYFNNTGLAGTPVLVRDDATINFQWGNGAPASGLPADGFSVRWTRTLALNEGTYRFFAHSDDGVRVYVDDALIINQWHDAANVTYETQLALSGGNHTFRVEYYENAGTAQIQFWWEELIAGYPDWRGEYFANRTLSGTPALVRNDPAIDFNWGQGAPATNLPSDNFSVRWTRNQSFDEATYRFHVVVDDGMRLYIDNILVIDEWRDGQQREVIADYQLAAGSHTLRVEYYENAVDATIRFSWERISGFPEWRGEYWSNPNLSGNPALVRNDREINFDWGLQSPAAGLPADDFSVKWTRQVTLEPGTYRFYAQVDDGVRVYVDFLLLIDQWHIGSADRPYIADRALSGGVHTIVVEYFEDSFGAEIEFRYERVGN
jgi:hypothetical protein